MIETAAAEKTFAPRPPAPSGEKPWLAALRRRAFDRFDAAGFPTAHDEEWRFTGLQPITGTAWTPAAGRASLSPLPDGVRRLSPTEAENTLGRLVPIEKSAFAALNTAFFDDAVVLDIARGAVVREPLAVTFTAPDGTGVVHYPRLLVLAGERSQASLVQTFTGTGWSFTDAVTEIALSDGAVLEHTLVQREGEEARHVHAVGARVGRGAVYTSHNVALGASLARTDLDVALAAEGAECALYGLFLGRGSQHLDTHTTIDHAKPHGRSRELYKGILDGSARGVFHGKILVRPDAQKTEAVQTNKNLLLSREALVNSTPALEILADDVKCKHGSTTGQLDAAALFYLQSRGIGVEEARALLTWAFAADVAERIPIPSVRAEVERELGRRLSRPGEEAA
ncbi:MAG TPA: Fe-S cluster assembly protein SufD [Thermoanaerobaculia bacterium]|jgi:Fe-S cluster assembly protein SufD|nr:Fe-S cluster assembly protein SufD [Thermoanaerobaculia bacterium]